MFHLGKKLRVGNVQKIPRLVRLKLVSHQHPVECRFAWSSADSFGMLFKVKCGPSKRPSANSHQRSNLTVESHKLHMELFRVHPRATATMTVIKIVCFSSAANPSSDHHNGALHKPGDGFHANTRYSQNEDRLAVRNPLCRRWRRQCTASHIPNMLDFQPF